MIVIPYIANTEKEIEEMLKVIGVDSIDDLFCDIKPCYKPKSFNIPSGKSEFEVLEYLKMLSDKNVQGLKYFIGGGVL